jgi:aspartate aminotransferase
MPQVSHRAHALPASPIRKLVPYADAAKERGIHVHHLNIGQPDLETPDAFWKAIRAYQVPTLEYCPSNGLVAYRTKLAAYYNAHFSLNVSPSDLLITTGGSEAVLFALAACLNPGDAVLTAEPFYANYLGLTRFLNAELRTIRTEITSGYALPNAEAFRAALTPQTRAILICNPSNPTGSVYTRSELEGLAQLCHEQGLFLISDEVYKEFVYSAEPFHSALCLETIREQVIVVDSISKRYSGCGARIGCLITTNRDVQQATLKMAQARLSPPTLGQIGAQALCDLPDTYYAEVKARYQERLAIVRHRLAAMPDVQTAAVQGAFYVFVRLPIDDADRFCTWLLSDFSLNGQTVMLAPGTGFYLNPADGRQYVRIAYVLEPAKLHQALDCLEQALATYPFRQPIEQLDAESILG